MEHIAEFIGGAWRIHHRATFLVENISASVVCHILPWIHPLHSALLEDLRSVTVRHTLGVFLAKTKYEKIIAVSCRIITHRSLSCDSHSNCRSRPLCVLETSAGWQTYRHYFARPESVASHHCQSMIIINDGIVNPEESNVVILSQVTDPASLCPPHELVVDDKFQDPEPPSPHWTSHCWLINGILVCSDVSLASCRDFLVHLTSVPPSPRLLFTSISLKSLIL